MPVLTVSVRAPVGYLIPDTVAPDLIARIQALNTSDHPSLYAVQGNIV